MFNSTFLKTFKFLILFTGLMATAVAETRIMPLGDSITYDNNHEDVENPRPTSMRTAYRNHLWYALEDAGYPADFVGTRKAGEAVKPPFDPDNEGHPGWTSYDIAENVYDYLEHTHPDIILLHIGTNDRRTSVQGVESILNEVDRFEQNTNHKIQVLVALIIDRQSSDPVIRVFNKNLQDLISQRRASGDILTLVDMFGKAGLTYDDYADNTHPNDNGYKKMAKVWFDALMAPYKPFNTNLKEYPEKLVDKSHILSIRYDEMANKVEFTAEIPDEGISF